MASRAPVDLTAWAGHRHRVPGWRPAVAGDHRRLGVADQFVSAALTRGAIGAVLGARLAYVANHLGSYDSPLKWFAIWNGGISLLGGIAGGLALGLPVIRRAGLPLWPVLDGIAPGLALGIAIGRGR
jgi:phosphatidylglycerol:prolipoprotein diacylglycerol transferase